MRSPLKNNRPAITALRPRRREPHRLTVYVDEEKLGVVSREWAAQQGLAVARVLTGAELTALTDRIAEEDIDGRLGRLLGRREYSRGELVRKFASYPAGIVERVIGSYVERGYIDDRRFARAWVSDRDRLKPCGARRLTMELRQRGVAADIIAAVLADRETDDYQLARVAYERAAGRWRGLDRDTWQRRVSGYLQRRGFSYDAVYAIMKEYQSSEQGTE